MTWTQWTQSHLGYHGGWLVFNTAMILLIALPLMLAVAMLIYAERKIWAAMALRRGPNVVGPFGLLQSFADGLKVFLQETIIPSAANKGLFLIAPIITFTVALIVWAVVPFGRGMALADINVGLLYILAASSLGVYGIIIAGWASNSKYPFYSALRAAAQMVSYEVSIGFVLLSVVLWAGSFNLGTIVEAQRGHVFGVFNMFGLNPLFFPMAVVFLISSMAETARAPFDLTEAESELVAGYQTEYSSMAFALYWLGEYANVILMCALNAILFWGGYLPPIDWAPLYLVPGILWLFLKIGIFFFIFGWVKATVPRYRYDQLNAAGLEDLPAAVAAVGGYRERVGYVDAPGGGVIGILFSLVVAAPSPTVLVLQCNVDSRISRPTEHTYNNNWRIMIFSGIGGPPLRREVWIGYQSKSSDGREDYADFDRITEENVSDGQQLKASFRLSNGVQLKLKSAGTGDERSKTVDLSGYSLLDPHGSGADSYKGTCQMTKSVASYTKSLIRHPSK